MCYTEVIDKETWRQGEGETMRKVEHDDFLFLLVTTLSPPARQRRLIGIP